MASTSTGSAAGLGLAAGLASLLLAVASSNLALARDKASRTRCTAGCKGGIQGKVGTMGRLGEWESKMARPGGNQETRGRHMLVKC